MCVICRSHGDRGGYRCWDGSFFNIDLVFVYIQQGRLARLFQLFGRRFLFCWAPRTQIFILLFWLRGIQRRSRYFGFFEWRCMLFNDLLQSFSVDLLFRQFCLWFLIWMPMCQGTLFVKGSLRSHSMSFHSLQGEPWIWCEYSFASVLFSCVRSIDRLSIHQLFYLLHQLLAESLLLLADYDALLA